MSMFNLSEINLGAIANVLNSIDSAAKETLEEPKQSATAIRRQKKLEDQQNTKSIDLNSNTTTDNDEITDRAVSYYYYYFTKRNFITGS